MIVKVHSDKLKIICDDCHEFALFLMMCTFFAKPSYKPGLWSKVLERKHLEWSKTILVWLLKVIKRLSTSFIHQTLILPWKASRDCMNKINTYWFIRLGPLIPWPSQIMNKACLATCHAIWFLRHQIKACIVSFVAHEQYKVLYGNYFEGLQEMWERSIDPLTCPAGMESNLATTCSCPLQALLIQLWGCWTLVS